MLDELGIEVERVTVTDLRDRTFYAEITLRTPAGIHTVSSRPSDAIALASRTGSPIFAEEDVLVEAGYVPSEDDEDQPDADEVVEQFKEFIETVNPEDFA
jgi:bifunctional DNase/RNase